MRDQQSMLFSRARLSEQAQKHLQGSEKFEDILLGSNRPTLVIQRYNELFSEGRMEALDAFDAVIQEYAGQKAVIRQRKLPQRDFSSQVLLEVLKVWTGEHYTVSGVSHTVSGGVTLP
jgi:hypothetical protein